MEDLPYFYRMGLYNIRNKTIEINTQKYNQMKNKHACPYFGFISRHIDHYNLYWISKLN
jgi:hypothetical protein